jgi:hypothetical protein
VNLDIATIGQSSTDTDMNAASISNGVGRRDVKGPGIAESGSASLH